MDRVEEAGNVRESFHFTPIDIYNESIYVCIYIYMQQTKRVCSQGISGKFECSIGVKQGCPLSPLLLSRYLDELESLLEEASEETDCPRLAKILIAILLFADDIALFSYSQKGLQRQ